MTEEEIAEVVRVFGETDSKQATADILGLSRSAVRRRLERAAELGMLGYEPVLPGYEIKQTTVEYDEHGFATKEWVKQHKAPSAEFEMPKGHVLKGISSYVDQDNRVRASWIKTKIGEPSIEDMASYLSEAFKEVSRPYKLIRPEGGLNEDLLTLYPVNDWHLGMFSWGKETDIDWDLDIGTKAIRAGMSEVINGAPNSKRAIVLVGGDLLHSDTDENRTAKSGNALDVDTRYAKILKTASLLVAEVSELVAQKHEEVIIRVLPGNHDERSAIAVAYFLFAWFRDEPNVTVDIDPSLFFWHRFGNVLLGSTHGHTIKAENMASIMAHRRAKDWGETKYRYVHVFHVHHKSKYVTENNGVITETHQAPIPQDVYHWNHGYLSGRSLQAITYHADRGECKRNIVTM